MTRQPAPASAQRVEALRAAGFNDTAILAAAQVTAYFNFVNRMALSLGVELEPERLHEA